MTNSLVGDHQVGWLVSPDSNCGLSDFILLIVEFEKGSSLIWLCP